MSSKKLYKQYKLDCIRVLTKWGILYPIFRFQRDSFHFEIYHPDINKHPFREKIKQELRRLPWNDGENVTIALIYNQKAYDELKAEKDAQDN